MTLQNLFGDIALDATLQAVLAALVQPAVVAGTISAQNTNLAGAATANSAVETDTLGRSTLMIQLVGTYTGTLIVQGTNNGTTWVTLSSTGTPIMNVGTGNYAGTIPSTTQGILSVGVGGFKRIRVTSNSTWTGSVAVSLSLAASAEMIAIDNPLPAGANNIGSVNIGNTPSTTATPVAGSGLGGTALAATTNQTLIKNSAGQIFEFTAVNLSSTDYFLKFYNKATAPVAGTDTPIYVVKVPANSEISREFGHLGKRFTTGIGFATTALQPTADTTAITAGSIVHGTFS